MEVILPGQVELFYGTTTMCCNVQIFSLNQIQVCLDAPMEQISTLLVQIIHFGFVSSMEILEHMEMMFVSVTIRNHTKENTSSLAFLLPRIIASRITLLLQIIVTGSPRLTLMLN